MVTPPKSPKNENSTDDQRRDEILLRMLKTPPKPRVDSKVRKSNAGGSGETGHAGREASRAGKAGKKAQNRRN